MEFHILWGGMLATGGCTLLGALPAMLVRTVTHRFKDMLLAYTAGIMVTASIYSLIPSALEMSNLTILCLGVLTGTLMLTLLEYLIPHHDLDHQLPVRGPHVERGTILFISAMALHNLPEGLSVGVSFASADMELAAVVSFAIGLQNIPEGALIAFYLLASHVRRRYALLLTACTGLMELVAFLAGYSFSQSVDRFVPYGLAFAAGAMLFIVYKELIPESHGDGHERIATFAFMAGLLSMIIMTHLLES
ncbi:ZIP family metal transporter [Marinicrinis sediminis]|uniref:ZIP family metal transporter n=1 Tax=Marinicrinis sediminis TaxID=1652465 RepID=A0ABW5R652_9BACL